jgi:hypothetical protein
MDNNCETTSNASFDSINYDNDMDRSIHQSYHDIESINRISNSREYKLNQKKKADFYMKLFLKSLVIFIIIIFNVPICVSELYYAFTDDSCTHIKNTNLFIDLYTYLAVDGIYGLIITIICSIYICCFVDIDNLELFGFKKIIIYIVSFIIVLFNLSWSIVGGIIFWNIIDDYTCNNNIYCFVFAELVIKLLFQFLQLIKFTSN